MYNYMPNVVSWYLLDPGQILWRCVCLCVPPVPGCAHHVVGQDHRAEGPGGEAALLGRKAAEGANDLEKQKIQYSALSPTYHQEGRAERGK